jgi:peptidoglycan hydrolase CwlO-like protein
VKLNFELQNNNRFNLKCETKNYLITNKDNELKKLTYKNNDLLLEIDKLNIEVKNLDYKISLKSKNVAEINE